MIGAFSLGHAAPNLQNIATARGAAYVVWGVIDRVSEWCGSFINSVNDVVWGVIDENVSLIRLNCLGHCWNIKTSQ